MAPRPSSQSPPPADSPPLPPPIPVETHPNRASTGLKEPSSPVQPEKQRDLPDPNRLAPEDAYYVPSMPKVRANCETGGPRSYSTGDDVATTEPMRSPPPALPGADPRPIEVRKVRGESTGRTTTRRRRKKGAWKKLLWVKQSYPDNYTDTETFLDHLQRNPRVRPYDFWPLVADSTVIVQHVCSVAIFVCFFIGIVQNRVSPVSVVCWGSVGTAVGWILWDAWVGKEQREASMAVAEQAGEGVAEGDDGSSAGSTVSSVNPAHPHPSSRTVAGQKEKSSEVGHQQQQAHRSNDEPSSSMPPGLNPTTGTQPTGNNPQNISNNPPSPRLPQEPPQSLRLSSRNRQRLTTLKSALMIYFALLGLSPILKSLTKSTASDSIWAMSCWLLITNIFSFDYGSGTGEAGTTTSSTSTSTSTSKFPASLSTNAAVMASTVLASRLSSTTHVFSLMLFSIEIFGLFPIFRRQLRHTSWSGHVALTLALVIFAGGAVGLTLRGGWFAAVVGSVLGSLLTAFAMGGCSWWLISLQKYKNVVTGPWDPARPILRRRWD